jgi:hypothetical protein
MLHPGLWKRALDARRKGFRQTGTAGDPRLMPGVFLIEDGRLIRRHDYSHPGDTPDFQEFVR